MNDRSGFKEVPKTQSIDYFILTVLGFSFWFFMAVPFASHRESYGWLSEALTGNVAHQFSFGVSSTYRPLAQIVTWSMFVALDPAVFPTNSLRQTILQGLVYGLFVVAWWVIYSAAPQQRVFAVASFIAGGVFFSGYVHLFHIYGLFYVPVISILGASLRFHASGTPPKGEKWLAIAALIFAFWHPFATALFIGFYFGFYIDTFRQRVRAQHVQAIVTLLAGIVVVAAVAFIFPRARMPLDTRLLGLLLSYQTNEVNAIASLVALMLSLAVLFSTNLSTRKKLAASAVVVGLGFVFTLMHLPLLLLWFSVVLMKLIRMRVWSLFFLALTAAVLPFGGAVGTPIHALFAIIIAVYVTALGWHKAETVASSFPTVYIRTATGALMIVVLMVRWGIDVPIVTRIATPLLAERERTYQLENVLAWLRDSDFCAYDIGFTENAGSPVDSPENVITRRNRPPASLEDVQFFWNNILRCPDGGRAGGRARTAIVTFGDSALTDATEVFALKGKYGGDTKVWIQQTQNR